MSEQSGDNNGINGWGKELLLFDEKREVASHD